jgi:hypothetical protein
MNRYISPTVVRIKPNARSAGLATYLQRYR